MKVDGIPFGVEIDNYLPDGMAFIGSRLNKADITMHWAAGGHVFVQLILPVEEPCNEG